MRSFDQEGIPEDSHETPDLPEEVFASESEPTEVLKPSEEPQDYSPQEEMSEPLPMPAYQPQTTTAQSQGNGAKDTVAKSVLVVGIVVVLIVLGWLGITAVRTLPNGIGAFTSAVLGVFQRDSIVVGINPDTIPTEEEREIIITWRHENRGDEEGFYSFIHGCVEGVELTTQNGDLILCDVPSRIDNEENAITVLANASTDVAEVAVPLSITFTETGKVRAKASGETALTVINTDIVVPEMTSTSIGVDDEDNETPSTNDITTPTPTTQTQTIIVNTPPVSNPDGTGDLAIALIAVGIVHEDTGEFTEVDGVIDLDALSSKENVAVKFSVTNLGDKTIEEWGFEAKLPTKPKETFEADEDDTGALLPEAVTEFVLGFDRAREGEEEIRIELDHDNEIDELSETNNVLVIPIETVD